MKMVKAGPTPYCLVAEIGWLLKFSISATGTASDSAVITGNNANEECSVHIISSPPSPLHFTDALIYNLATVAR